ncbi:hypothetical protein B0H11DRAFT_1955888 [Mycena galericulata]|nr:hypothetical protein B0H11DRAFT_1955888 [Mycena galericulata]
MPLHQYPLDNAFLVATWLEALVYGFYFCIFCLSIYVNITSTRGRTTHNQTIFAASITMFILATTHVAINCYRLIRGYVDFGTAPGGPVGYLGVISTWHFIFKDVLYATQSILGDAAAVYRCWILWKQEYKIVLLPFMLLVMSAVSGYMVCGLHATMGPTATVFDPRLTKWITTFYSLAVAQNCLTTGLMACRLWQGERESARFRLGSGIFLPVLRVLVESAALYLFVEILLLCLYAVRSNAQYILLETVPPIVGITFSSITVRINLRAHQQANNVRLQSFGSFALPPISVSMTTRAETDSHVSLEAK